MARKATEALIMCRFALCIVLLLAPQMVQRTIDGDTLVVHHYGYGYRGLTEEHIRALGYDAPERGDSLYYAARDSLSMWLARGLFKTESCRRDNFGRVLAWITRPTDRGDDSLHVHMVRLGLGVRR